MREESWDSANNRAAEADIAEGERSEAEWMQLARSAYHAAVDWREGNVAQQWERNLRSFNSEHPTGSKYFSDEYKYRSKLFRPKTRSTIRKHEAAVTAAFFSTQDPASVEPQNENDPAQLASAEVNKQLLAYRLDKNPIKWFQTCIGAFQDTRVVGVCVSHQWWEYEERVETVAVEDPLSGGPLLDEDGDVITQDRVTVLKDVPHIDLLPPENVLLDPGASWLDPINTSPYVVRQVPMYVTDVEDRMKHDWRPHDRATILKAGNQEYDSTRQARERYREDSKESHNTDVRDHEIVWCYEVYMRLDGEDWVWWMLGTVAMLTEPRPVREVYPHLDEGERPLVMGFSTLEAHVVYPAALSELLQGLQQEANEIANQRIDNVRYAMNPRVFYRRSGDVDLPALNASRPGGPVSVNDPSKDIHIDRPPEVTSSAYAEQDRINVDFDELAGAFSQSSVQTNRNLNETVGGMNMISQSADSVTDLDVMVFAETWVEPVMRQLVKMEQFYETDERILALAGQRAQLYQRYGIDQVTDQLLREDVTVKVSVGMGATNPLRKLEKFRLGATTLRELFGDVLPRRMDFEAVSKEVFGTLGFEDGSRFFVPSDDPRFAHLEGVIEELQQAQEIEKTKTEGRLQETMAKLQSERQLAQDDHATELTKTAMQERGDTQRQLSEQAHEVRMAIAEMRRSLADNAETRNFEREKLQQTMGER